MNPTDLSNLEGIFDAVYQTALDINGIAWHDSHQGLWPENNEIKGFPHLVVPFPSFAGFGRGGVLTGKTMIPGTQLIELLHDIDVYAIAPYNRSNPLTWRVPMRALAKIVRAFRLDRTLGGACINTKLIDPHLLEFHDKQNPALRFFGCQLTVQCYEQVLTPDT